MLAEPLIALAARGGNAIVEAATTTAWPAARSRMARLFARGDEDRRTVMERRLEETRTRLDEVRAQELEPLRRRLTQSWTTRLEDLLEDHPDSAGDLRQILDDLVSSATRRSTGPAG
jgi:hypothetical protein